MNDGEAQPTKRTEALAPGGVNRAPQTSFEAPNERGSFFDFAGCALALAALFLAGAALFVRLLPSYGPSYIANTRNDAATIRFALIVFRAEHPDANSDKCPSVRQLVADQYLDNSMRLEDSWGLPFRTVCDGRDVRVYSAGPDGAFDTADDVNR